MTATNWYATELLVDERKREIERASRVAADRHLAPTGRRTRRFGRRS